MKNPSESNSAAVPSTTTVAPSASAPVTYDATLSRCSRVMSGPISDAGSAPGPMRSVATRDGDLLDEGVRDLVARRPRAPRRPCSARPPTRTRPRPRRRRRRRDRHPPSRPCGSSHRREPARACPARWRARRSTGPPESSRRSSPHATSGESMIASTASLSPCTTLRTPAGSPASSNSFARNTEALGSFSLGLSTTVLPHAMADAVIQSGTMIGKLKGVIAPTTPTGCLTEWTSTPRATCSERSPLSRWTRPAANSTFSMPRLISPFASESTLPCSLVMIAASSSWRSTSSWRRRKKTSARFTSPVARQPGSAASAAAIASCDLAVVAKATSRWTAPVAGSKTGPVRCAPPVSRPSTRWRMRLMGAPRVLSGQIDRASTRLTESQHVRAEEAATVPDRREDHAIHTDRPERSIGARDPPHGARGDRARCRRAGCARRCWSATTRSTRGCAGCTSPTAPASPGCSTAASCCCRPDRRGRPSPASCAASSANSPMPGSRASCSSSARTTAHVPAVVVDAAAERGLALIVLHREVKFVTLTEAVHSRIIAGADRRAARARRGARAVHRARRCADRPPTSSSISSRRPSAHPSSSRTSRTRSSRPKCRSALEEELFTEWELRSRSAHRRAEQRRDRCGAPGADDWLVVPVEARGIRWGNLIALPGPDACRRPRRRARAGCDRARGRAARRRRRRRVGADRSAPAARRAARGALRRIAGGAAARLEAAGLPLRGARLYGIVVSGAPVTAEAADAAARALRGRALTGSAPEGVAAPASAIVLVAPRRRARSTTRLRSAFARALVDPASDADRVVVSVGQRRGGARRGAGVAARGRRPRARPRAAAPDAARTCGGPRTVRSCSW